MISDNRKARGDTARFRISFLLPQGTVPTAGTWGAFFSGKEPAPHPGRKAPGRFDFALDPQRHKGRGPRPPPLETNPQGDEGRETRIKPETDRVVRSEAERTGVEMRRFGFALHFALHPQVRGYADLIFGYSAAGR